MSEQIDEALRTATAAKDYFLRAWRTEIQNGGIVALTHDEATVYAKRAAEWASEEMDGFVIEPQLIDHCLHWVVDLRLPELAGTDHEVVEEVSLNPLHITEVDMYTLDMFFREMVAVVVQNCPESPLTPSYVLDVFEKLEELQASCEGCKRAYRITEVKHINNGFVFCFSAIIGGPEKKLHMTFEALRTIERLAGI